MSFSVVAATVAVGYMAYSNNQAKNAANAQRDAVNDQRAADAAATAKAQTDANNATNQQRVAAKRAYQANVLALGGQRDATLGGTSVLGAGAPAGSPVTSSAAKAQTFFS